MTSKTDQAQERADNTLESVQPADQKGTSTLIARAVTEALKRYDDLDGGKLEMYITL